MISIKSSREIDLMRKTCRLAASTLEYIEDYIKPGVSTEEITQLCHEYITKNGAYPSPLNYHGFPKSVCTSLNEVVCHGIPNKKVSEWSAKTNIFVFLVRRNQGKNDNGNISYGISCNRALAKHLRQTSQNLSEKLKYFLDSIPF